MKAFPVLVDLLGQAPPRPGSTRSYARSGVAADRSQTPTMTHDGDRDGAGTTGPPAGETILAADVKQHDLPVAMAPA